MRRVWEGRAAGAKTLASRSGVAVEAAAEPSAGPEAVRLFLRAGWKV